MSIQVFQQTLSNGSRLTTCHDGDITDLIKEQLIGVSRWANEARAFVLAHACHDNPILIEGERGTGKEFVARLIHECSPRCGRPFVALSCEALTEESLEVALFGSIRALPSGRNRTQRGLVESAEGGTVYLSGISTLPSVVKVKLVRLIQHQEFRRPGDNLLEPADVRIIFGSAHASTSSGHEPHGLDNWGLAIHDVLEIPRLCRRRADIEGLSNCFSKQFCQRMGKEPRRMSPEALGLLRRHNWPGNVGELKRVIEEMVEKSTPPLLDPSLLPIYLIDPSNLNGTPLPVSGIHLNEEVDRFERSLLCAALKHCHGKQSKAAELLGLKRTTLNTKIIRYGIDVSAYK